ncbi:unnamed protein product, partial [Prorocentrum cordatum]
SCAAVVSFHHLHATLEPRGLPDETALPVRDEVGSPPGSSTSCWRGAAVQRRHRARVALRARGRGRPGRGAPGLETAARERLAGAGRPRRRRRAGRALVAGGPGAPGAEPGAG